MESPQLNNLDDLTISTRIEWNGDIWRMVADDRHSANPFQKKWDCILLNEKTGEVKKVWEKDLQNYRVIS